MNATTAVLITTSAAVSSRLLHGAVVDRQRHPRGTLLVLPPAEVAVYCVRAVELRTFIFRTIEAPEALSSELPGVSRSVRLLVQTRKRGRSARVEQLLVYLKRNGVQPAALSDSFYLRLNAVINGRFQRTNNGILSLLDRELSHRQVSR